MIILGSAFISCKKDEEKTAKDFLVDNSCWNLVKLEQKQDNGTWNDLSGLVLGEACSADDCYKFSSDNKYEINEGASKCDPDDDQVYETGTWSLSADNKTLTMTTSDGDTQGGEVEELTEGTLKLLSTDPTFGTIRITLQ